MNVACSFSPGRVLSLAHLQKCRRRRTTKFGMLLVFVCRGFLRVHHFALRAECYKCAGKGEKGREEGWILAEFDLVALDIPEANFQQASPGEIIS